MNAWDRTAYISNVKYGRPSYEAQMNQVNNNFIIASTGNGHYPGSTAFARTSTAFLTCGPVPTDYGASQGFDTDDGSSWYDIHDNFMFMADGMLATARNPSFILSSINGPAVLRRMEDGLWRPRLAFHRQRGLSRP